eukprot:gnl/TRDRNA2_/TRDRNA2_156865_c0_seq2.p1 gnl/TRDRNA2_/TRDRNA2_156865_c0~~gnl/TRDRNA2_/TRDRNA2_156865_c0_seq2.p1  ORF type:complete len:762 (-),score=114.73 gnl/TRDRNA2_/TRDRNA2_156865_c0_seq2:17-2302(-)
MKDEVKTDNQPEDAMVLGMRLLNRMLQPQPEHEGQGSHVQSSDGTQQNGLLNKMLQCDEPEPTPRQTARCPLEENPNSIFFKKAPSPAITPHLWSPSSEDGTAVPPSPGRWSFCSDGMQYGGNEVLTPHQWAPESEVMPPQQWMAESKELPLQQCEASQPAPLSAASIPPPPKPWRPANEADSAAEQGADEKASATLWNLLRGKPPNPAHSDNAAPSQPWRPPTPPPPVVLQAPTSPSQWNENWNENSHENWNENSYEDWDENWNEKSWKASGWNASWAKGRDEADNKQPDKFAESAQGGSKSEPPSVSWRKILAREEATLRNPGESTSALYEHTERNPAAVWMPRADEPRKRCAHFAMGKCKWGDACYDSHDEAPANNTWRKPCPHFAQGRCTWGSRCFYSHIIGEDRLLPEELRPMPPSLDKVQREIEFLLGDTNLRTDQFFHNMLSTDKGRWMKVEELLCHLQALFPGGISEQYLLCAARKSVDFEVVTARNESWIRPVRALPCLDPPRPSHETTEPSLEEMPLFLLSTRYAGWRPFLEDYSRRAFCHVRSAIASPDSLAKDMKLLVDGVAWSRVCNPQGKVTRMTAWYALDSRCRCDYTYGYTTTHSGTPSPAILDLCNRHLSQCGLTDEEWPNTVNLNLYADGTEGVGWHADDEALFGGLTEDCRILSVSLGATRAFEVALRTPSRSDPKPLMRTVRRVHLEAGDMLVMEGAMQKHYLHALPPCEASSPPVGPRVNLTFRTVKWHTHGCPLQRKYM